MPISPTVRTLALLRQDFQFVAITEKWNPHAKIRQDLFNCIDIVAIGAKSIIGVQCTSGVNHLARKKKILKIPAAKAWLKSGNQLWVVSWSKLGKKGSIQRWTEKVEFIRLEDFK